MRSVTHPGPLAPDRLTVVPSAGVPVTLMLQPGLPLLDAVGDALAAAGHDSAWLWLQGAETETLDYVMPDHAPDDTHVAWYSTPQGLTGAVIGGAGMLFGHRNGGRFIHCHGVWTGADGVERGGHMLPDRTRLAHPSRATGRAFPSARFDGIDDAETNFTLFSPVGRGDDGGADWALVRVHPNIDLTAALCRACDRLDWSAAGVHGLGSLNEARFDGAAPLASLATEFLVTGGAVAADGTGAIDILIVGMDGVPRRGRLTVGDNPVLITAEILLERRLGLH